MFPPQRSSLQQLYDSAIQAQTNPLNHQSILSFLPTPRYRQADTNFWALRNPEHGGAITRRAVAPIINMAHYKQPEFQDFLVRSPAMETHIVPDHGYRESGLSTFPPAFGRPPRSQRQDNPSLFSTNDPYHIADLGCQTVLGGAPYLSQPGWGRGNQEYSPTQGHSVLDFVHTFPDTIGIHEGRPTPTARFSFELAPTFSSSFPNITRDVRLMTGHPVRPEAAVSTIPFGVDAAPTGLYKCGGSIKPPYLR